MTSRTVTIAGYLLILATGPWLNYLGRTRRADLPTLTEALRATQATRLGRTATFVAWFWLGWHFLAR